MFRRDVSSEVGQKDPLSFLQIRVSRVEDRFRCFRIAPTKRVPVRRHRGPEDDEWGGITEEKVSSSPSLYLSNTTLRNTSFVFTTNWSSWRFLTPSFLGYPVRSLYLVRTFYSFLFNTDTPLRYQTDLVSHICLFIVLSSGLSFLSPLVTHGLIFLMNQDDQPPSVTYKVLFLSSYYFRHVTLMFNEVVSRLNVLLNCIFPCEFVRLNRFKRVILTLCSTVVHEGWSVNDLLFSCEEGESPTFTLWNRRQGYTGIRRWTRRDPKSKGNVTG